MPLDKFEALAQRLVEGSFKRLFGGELEPLEVATGLAKAMEDDQDNGRCPDLFTVYLHPHDLEAITQTQSNLSSELARHVTRLAQQANLLLTTPPHVMLEADSSVRRHHVAVSAKHTELTDAPTQAYRPPSLQVAIDAKLQKLDAYLVVNGRQYVTLDKPMLTIGRHQDNDIIIESSTVSRLHAQLRWRYGRFILYDVSGRGRTAVNGQTITECALKPGDVITLSNISLIYGEGHDNVVTKKVAAPPPDGYTQPFTPPK